MKDLLDLIAILKDAQSDGELLEAIFLELGPYGNGKLSTETLIKLRKRFKFDDSE